MAKVVAVNIEWETVFSTEVRLELPESLDANDPENKELIQQIIRGALDTPEFARVLLRRATTNEREAQVTGKARELGPAEDFGDVDLELSIEGANSETEQKTGRAKKTKNS